MMKNKRFMLCISIFLSVIFSMPVAADTTSIKSRMKARLPIIKALKKNGIIGENNKGYLEFIADKDKEDVVKAENQDRRTIYSAIAQQQGTKIEVVEIHRAAQIEEKAESGEWLQDANGKWYQKKY
ncbi:MAG: YdbL family protein [Desulfobacterales bacterium]|nr:YdbL family protein [Desulfobacterales bacterium]